jgi:hypothetical protein
MRLFVFRALIGAYWYLLRNVKMPKNAFEEPRVRRLLTVRQFSKRYPAFTEGSLRWLIFNAKEPRSIEGNGLNVALVRIGRRVLIDEDRFFEWIETQQ